MNLTQPLRKEELGLEAPHAAKLEIKGKEEVDVKYNTAKVEIPKETTKEVAVKVQVEVQRPGAKEMLNKTVNFQQDKINLSLIGERAAAQPKSRAHAFDQSVDRSRIQVCMETSNAEKYAGMNVSYENSFSAIKKNILKETVDRKYAGSAGGSAATEAATAVKEVIPNEEKPNKPKDKFIVKNMSPNSLNQTLGIANNLNMTQEVKPSNAINVEDFLNKTGAVPNYSTTRGSKLSQDTETHIQNLREKAFHSPLATTNERPKTSHHQAPMSGVISAKRKNETQRLDHS